MRRLQVVGALCLAISTCFLAAATVSAAPTDPLVYQRSLDGSGIPGGIENPQAIVVNHETGNILVYEHGVIDQYDEDGNPVDFPALGSPTLPIGVEGGAIAIDNTGGSTQGNIYLIDVQHESGYGSDNLWSYAADGSSLGGSNPHNVLASLGGIAQAIGVMPDGSLEVVFLSFSNFTQETVRADPIGQPVSPNQPFSPNTVPASPYVFDELGNLYTQGQGGALGKYPVAGNYAYEGETGLPLDRALAADPSANDIYLRQGSKVRSVPYSEPLTQATPSEVLSGAQGEGPIAFDATGQTLYVAEGSKITVFHREPLVVPRPAQSSADAIGSSHAMLHGSLLPAQGGITTYRFEYGLDTSYGSSTPETTAPGGFYPVAMRLEVKGLKGGELYHVRLAATGPGGTSYGPDSTFKTYPDPVGGDPCANALARKQTAAQRLPDCRAYELASASDTGGYDVESYLAPGQTPFPGFPLAKDKLLYSTHSGAIPGPWNATNHGPDPYVATRTANGWVTDYEGLPADLNPSAGLFSSVLGEADSSLGTLAFAGANLCDPCFSSGLRTGIPLRLPDGRLVQGMTGSLAGSVDPSAKPEGRVAKYFSGDGKHLIFASKYAFESGANTGGDLTVYDRNLTTGTTQVVSTDQAGNPLAGTISELDVSADGTRIVTATKRGVDAQGNELVHPFMHVGSSPSSVNLAPGTSTGVLYAGMTSDGSKVFFTTKDALVAEDTDHSTDLYEAAVDAQGNLDLEVITAPDVDACNPVSNSNGDHWNTGSPTADCSAVAISGGGGVASATGAVYFLSPEQLDGTKGAANQPNLYLAQPGVSPEFVATLEPNNPLVLDSVKTISVRRTGDFQTTPSGSYAAFTSNRELTAVHTFGLRQAFRFDAAARQLLCASCDTTNTADGSLADNVELAPNGLSLLADGRLFFSTRMRLVLGDTNAREDVYELTKADEQALISAGIGRFDSALLSASADGTDVFFFTHDALAPEEDRNGQQMKVYDAREGGGFFKLPTPVPCQASDECHGPSTPAPAPADIKSSGKTTQGNFLTCPKNRVKKRGQCVKKPAQRKNKKHAKKKGAKKRHASTTGKRGA